MTAINERSVARFLKEKFLQVVDVARIASLDSDFQGGTTDSQLG